MSQITIGGTTLNFKDSAFTGDQWEQVASWVLNGGAEGIDANAQIATEKAAAASASAAAARNSATSAGESATAAANSATSAKASEDAAAGSAANAAASATSAGKSAAAASERAANAANSASVASSKSNDAIAAASDAQAAKNKAANSQAAAKKSEDNAAANATNAGKSASSAANSAASASSSATAAENSAASAAESIKHAPRINSDGKWELWDATTNAYVATEYTSIGENGARGLGWYQHSVKASNPQVVAWTGWLAAPKWGEGDWLYNPDNGNVGLCTSRTDKADGSGSASITYKGTLKGTDGTTPHIGANGNWYIGDTDTGVSAGGASYIFKVTVVDGPGGPDTLSANKTLAEIRSAYSSGSMVVAQQGSSLYELTYVSNTKVEFTHVNETYCDVLSCANSGDPQEIDGWLLNRTKRINYDTKYGDIGQKTVPVAIKELQDKSAPTVTDADAGKYLHVNASTKKLEWAEVESGGGSELPAVTAADAGKFLRVSSSGSWVVETVANASGGEF